MTGKASKALIRDSEKDFKNKQWNYRSLLLIKNVAKNVVMCSWCNYKMCREIQSIKSMMANLPIFSSDTSYLEQRRL